MAPYAATSGICVRSETAAKSVCTWCGSRTCSRPSAVGLNVFLLFVVVFVYPNRHLLNHTTLIQIQSRPPMNKWWKQHCSSYRCVFFPPRCTSPDRYTSTSSTPCLFIASLLCVCCVSVCVCVCVCGQRLTQSAPVVIWEAKCEYRVSQ